MRRRLLWQLIVAVAVALSTAQAFAFDFSKLEDSVTEFSLDNGLKFIVMERHDAPVVSLITWADVGACQDPLEYTGIAHMLEHMAFKGTKTLGATDIDAELEAMDAEDVAWEAYNTERKKGPLADPDRVEELKAKFDAAVTVAEEFGSLNVINGLLEKHGGVAINAGTSKDYTAYQVELPSNKLELWMAIESDRFTNPVFRTMYTEREVIAEERKQVLEDNPIMRALTSLQSTAFEAHPYQVPVIGHMSDIRNYSRQAVQAHFDKYYGPTNLVIAIVGDVDPKHVKKLAEKYFADLKHRPKPPPLATIEPEQQGEKRAYLQDPAQPLFLAAYHVPGVTHPDWPAVDAIMDYLGGGRSAPLYERLVKDEQLAADVGMQWWPGNKYPCLAIVYAMLTPGSENSALEEVTLAEFDRLREDLLPSEEVEKIKARAKAGYINGLTNNLGMADALARYQTYFGDWREVLRELDRINALTPEDIQRVAREYFVETNRTIVHLNTTQG